MDVPANIPGLAGSCFEAQEEELIQNEQLDFLTGC